MQQEAMIDLKRTHEGETPLILRKPIRVLSWVLVSRKTGIQYIGSLLRVCSASVLKIYFRFTLSEIASVGTGDVAQRYTCRVCRRPRIGLPKPQTEKNSFH